MRLKSILSPVLLGLICVVVFISCKSKVSDADLKAKVEQVVNSNPTVFVDVKDAVVTLTGNVQNEDERLNLEKAAKAAEPKAIKSVVNNLSITPVLVSSDDIALTDKVLDATKDFPNIKATVAEGIITVTGEVEQARIQTLKMSLDALNPKKVDLSGVKVK